MFLYDPVRGVVVCRVCSSCVVPGQSGQERHLRADPHRLLGDVLKATVQLLSNYKLKTIEELKDQARKLRVVHQLRAWLGTMASAVSMRNAPTPRGICPR